ncbi:hypothetical protein O6H91_06G105100 [Diphasiastrum complanatum]|uniref:Uncharacterized protein n=1 Tax=Diphasiastrum complanatum TaxID=34168 RepID=A0ACC2DH37_DIPCM|nr:hypothetical protein O6H91_06G105100 [Diphasiastrum complanatum]
MNLAHETIHHHTTLASLHPSMIHRSIPSNLFHSPHKQTLHYSTLSLANTKASKAQANTQKRQSKVKNPTATRSWLLLIVHKISPSKQALFLIFNSTSNDRITTYVLGVCAHSKFTIPFGTLDATWKDDGQPHPEALPSRGVSASCVLLY